MLAEDILHFRGTPAFMAKFHGPPVVGGQTTEEFIELGVISFKVRRQLEQCGSQFVAVDQGCETIEHCIDHGKRLCRQAFEMSDLSMGFGRKDEILRRLFSPYADRRYSRQSIPDTVQLYRVVTLGVVP